MNILWLKSELLHPVNRGGRIRTYQMLRALKRDHRITYLTLDDGSAASNAVALADEYCHEVDSVPFTTTPKDSWRLFADLARNLFSPMPYAIAKYKSRTMRGRIKARVASGEFDVLVCDFLFPSPNVPADLGLPAVLFQHNVEAEIWRRHTEVATGMIRRQYFAEQWRRMVRVERRECRRYDHVVAVSEEDAATFRRAYGLQHVSAIPTGVDTTYFAPGADLAGRGHTMVFTGSMDWMPNEDAVFYFLSEIHPLVRQAIPDAQLVVVGRNPSSRLTQLASITPGVQVVGSVPDVRPFMNRAAVFVVPLRIGGGTRLKLFEAMAMGLPTVTTTVGAEGLPLTPGEHALFADDAVTFARSVVGLLRAPGEAEALARRSSVYVRSHFSWTHAATKFADVCEGVIFRKWGERQRSTPV